MNFSVIYLGQEYLLMMAFILISVGMIKENNLFSSTYAYVRKNVKDSRILVALLSAIGGILPVSGRVTISAGLLDTIAPNKGDPARQNYGIVDYLSTHHYYLWSPLEKTIVLPMAAFGLSYMAIMSMLWPLLAISILLVFFYIFYYIKESDVTVNASSAATFKMSEIIRNVLPMFAAIVAVINDVDPVLSFGLLTVYYCFLTQTWDHKKLLSYVNWELILIIAAVIVFSNFVKLYEPQIVAFVKQTPFNMSTISGITLVSATALISGFILGSSARFVALAIILAQIFGSQYFVWFFALEFAGYLLSPAHKCVAIGIAYFQTPLRKYVSVLGLWALLVIGVAGFITF